MVAEVEHFVTTRFDDLYRRVEAGLRTRDGSTSLKIVEKLAGYDRTEAAAAVGKADDSIKAYEAYLAVEDDAARAALLEGIRAYNEHDVKATRAVHLWLRTLAAELADDDLLDEPDDDYTPPDAVLLRAARTEELQRAAARGGRVGPAAVRAVGGGCRDARRDARVAPARVRRRLPGPPAAAGLGGRARRSSLRRRARGRARVGRAQRRRGRGDADPAGHRARVLPDRRGARQGATRR